MKLVGLIAEDQSDVDVVHELAKKIATKRFAIRRVLGHGCGRIHAKSRAWAGNLKRQGCSLLILICDLDRRSLTQLSASLRDALHPCPIEQHVVVIPVREIEAWLLADHEAVTLALRLKQSVKKQANPESIVNPKERLRDIIKERSKGQLVYLNTIHNVKIAKQVKIKNIERCSSFIRFGVFIHKNLC